MWKFAHTTKRHVLTRTVALLLSLIFTAIVTLEASPVPLFFAAPHHATLSMLPDSLPAEWGKIGDVYLAPDFENRPFIFHIQDAHGQVDAQKNIKELLGFLEKEYGIRQAFVEGAFTPLNPELFGIFPNHKLNVKIAENLAAQAEFSGLELFLLDSKTNFRATGIENPNLYRANLNTFKKVYQNLPRAEKFLRKIDQAVEQAVQRLENKNLRDFLKTFRRWESSVGTPLTAPAGQDLPLQDFAMFLAGKAKETIGTDVTGPLLQKNWPNLARFVRIYEISKDKSFSQSDRTREHEMIRAKLEAAGAEASLLDSLKKMVSGETAPSRRILKRICDTVNDKSFSLPAYPHLRRRAALKTFESEMDAGGLYAEIYKLSDRILMTLAGSEVEREMVRFVSDISLLNDFFHLELTREGYRAYQMRRESFQPDVLTQRIFRAAERFYEAALARESVFVEKTLVYMKRTGEKRVVLITGGFHTEGITKLLRDQKISYAVISPQIKNAESRDAYISALTDSRSSVGAAPRGRPFDGSAEAPTLTDYLSVAVKSVPFDGWRKTYRAMGIDPGRVIEKVWQAVSELGVNENLISDVRRRSMLYTSDFVTEKFQMVGVDVDRNNRDQFSEVDGTDELEKVESGRLNQNLWRGISFTGVGGFVSSIARIATQRKPSGLFRTLPLERRPSQSSLVVLQRHQPAKNSIIRNRTSPARTPLGRFENRPLAKAPAKPTFTRSIKVLANKLRRAESNMLRIFSARFLVMINNKLINLLKIISLNPRFVNVFMASAFQVAAARSDAASHGGVGLRNIGQLMQETPVILKYRRNEQHPFTLETILEFQLLTEGSKEAPDSRKEKGFGADSPAENTGKTMVKDYHTLYAVLSPYEVALSQLGGKKVRPLLVKSAGWNVLEVAKLTTRSGERFNIYVDAEADRWYAVRLKGGPRLREHPERIEREDITGEPHNNVEVVRTTERPSRTLLEDLLKSRSEEEMALLAATKKLTNDYMVFDMERNSESEGVSVYIDRSGDGDLFQLSTLPPTARRMRQENILNPMYLQGALNEVESMLDQMERRPDPHYLWLGRDEMRNQFTLHAVRTNGLPKKLIVSSKRAFKRKFKGKRVADYLVFDTHWHLVAIGENGDHYEEELVDKFSNSVALSAKRMGSSISFYFDRIKLRGNDASGLQNGKHAAELVKEIIRELHRRGIMRPHLKRIHYHHKWTGETGTVQIAARFERGVKSSASDRGGLRLRTVYRSRVRWPGEPPSFRARVLSFRRKLEFGTSARRTPPKKSDPILPDDLREAIQKNNPQLIVLSSARSLGWTSANGGAPARSDILESVARLLLSRRHILVLGSRDDVETYFLNSLRFYLSSRYARRYSLEELERIWSFLHIYQDNGYAYGFWPDGSPKLYGTFRVEDLDREAKGSVRGKIVEAYQRIFSAPWGRKGKPHLAHSMGSVFLTAHSRSLDERRAFAGNLNAVIADPRIHVFATAGGVMAAAGDRAGVVRTAMKRIGIRPSQVLFLSASIEPFESSHELVQQFSEALFVLTDSPERKPEIADRRIWVVEPGEGAKAVLNQISSVAGFGEANSGFLLRAEFSEAQKSSFSGTTFLSVREFLNHTGASERAVHEVNSFLFGLAEPAFVQAALQDGSFEARFGKKKAEASSFAHPDLERIRRDSGLSVEEVRKALEKLSTEQTDIVVSRQTAPQIFVTDFESLDAPEASEELSRYLSPGSVLAVFMNGHSSEEFSAAFNAKRFSGVSIERLNEKVSTESIRAIFSKYTGRAVRYEKKLLLSAAFGGLLKRDLAAGDVLAFEFDENLTPFAGAAVRIAAGMNRANIVSSGNSSFAVPLRAQEGDMPLALKPFGQGYHAFLSPYFIRIAELLLEVEAAGELQRAA